MNGAHKQKSEELRTALQQLFEDAGYENIELLQCVDAFERTPEANLRIEELTAENERLRLSIKKMTADKLRKTDNLSSRLRDALRE